MSHVTEAQMIVQAIFELTQATRTQTEAIQEQTQVLREQVAATELSTCAIYATTTTTVDFRRMIEHRSDIADELAGIDPATGERSR